MADAPIVISLPIADRRTAHDFYRDGLGLTAVGAPADDGLPEPLQFQLNEGALLMLVPSGGFGWVVGDREVAPPGTSECVLSVSTATTSGVDALVERARRAGAAVVTEPGHQPWGYAAVVADPNGHLWMVVEQPGG